MPKVSIITLAYNTEKYIERCLDSLLCQTMRDIEIVVVDDCSTDGTPGILADYSSRDERIKVVRHSENCGALWGRKTGIEASTGDHILFVDGDDSVEPVICQRLYDLAKENDADLVISGLLIHNTDNTVRKQVYHLRYGSDSNALLKSFVMQEIQVVLSGKLFKKELLKGQPFSYYRKHNGFDDFLINFQMCHNVRKAVCVEDTLYHYFKNPSSGTVRRFNEGYLDTIMRSCRHMLEITDKAEPEIAARARLNVVRVAMDKIRNRYDRKLIKRLLKNNGLSELFTFSSLRDLMGIRKACWYSLAMNTSFGAWLVAKFLGPYKA